MHYYIKVCKKFPLKRFIFGTHDCRKHYVNYVIYKKKYIGEGRIKFIKTILCHSNENSSKYYDRMRFVDDIV
jgi:hypothetical protein